MKLIADAGATKIDWAIINNKNVVSFKTSGYNPNVADSNYLRQLLITAFPEKLDANLIHEVMYFGTGCGSDFGIQRVEKALSTFFINAANINVITDLEGAAYGVLGEDTGIVGILGTGSNAGYYNGNTIEYTPPSLGYLLGDEGSGAYLGKMLLAKILRAELSDEICKVFYLHYKTSAAELVAKIYSQQKINQYLASFVPFIKDNILNEDILNLVHNAFEKYFKFYIHPVLQKHKSDKIVLVGGVANAFSEQVRYVFSKQNLMVKITESPITTILARI